MESSRYRLLEIPIKGPLSPQTSCGEGDENLPSEVKRLYEMMEGYGDNIRYH